MENQNIVIYTDEQGQVALDVNLENETVWLSQKQMSMLFDKNVKTINEHIGNIFKEGELEQKSVIRNFRITAADGKSYDVSHYSLDVIISVGYRVKSKRGTQFRIWANKVLKEYLIKGYAVNQKRLDEKSLHEPTVTIELVRKVKRSYCNECLRCIATLKNLVYIIQLMIRRLEVSSVIMLNPLRCIIYIHRGVAPFVKSEAL